MKKRLATIYAVFLTVLLVAGFLATFFFAWQSGTWDIVGALCGFVLGFVLAPIIHELGHVCFALTQNMDYVYVKCFCIRIMLKNGKKRFSLASPFAPDETQVIPKTGGDMQRRAAIYTLGGLIFSGFYLLLILGAAIVCSCLGRTRFELWGMLPYFGYLFLLNLPFLEYNSGKTDTLIWRGIKNGYAAEKNMLAAMEIQGRLFAGNSFAEIEEACYYDVPQLCEDEPLFAVMLDLRYRYHLEKGEIEKAGDCLNRLAQAQAYLPDKEIEKLAAEFTYMHAIGGNIEGAEESGRLCREFLKEDTATAKRVLLAYSVACGKDEAIQPLRAQAETALQKEYIAGVRKFEKILIERIPSV